VELPPVPLTVAVVTAVSWPFSFTVMTGTAVALPNVPGLPFTVAKVDTTLPLDAARVVTSPVSCVIPPELFPKTIQLLTAAQPVRF